MEVVLLNVGLLILRFGLGILLLLHGIFKIKHGISGMVSMMEGYHIPGFVTYGVYIGEVVAPILLMLGIFPRWSAGIIVVNMIVAIAAVHSKELFSLNNMGGLAIELPLLYLIMALVLVFTGAGQYSLMSYFR